MEIIRSNPTSGSALTTATGDIILNANTNTQAITGSVNVKGDAISGRINREETILVQLINSMIPVTTLQGTTQFTSGTGDVQSGYTQMLAAASVVKDIPANSLWLSGGIRNNEASAGRAILQVGIGGAGSESVVWSSDIGIAASAAGQFNFAVPRKIVAGTRLAVRCAWSGAAGATVDVGFNVGQIA